MIIKRHLSKTLQNHTHLKLLNGNVNIAYKYKYHITLHIKPM